MSGDREELARAEAGLVPRPEQATYMALGPVLGRREAPDRLWSPREG